MGGRERASLPPTRTYSLDDKHGVLVVVVVSPLDEDASSHAHDVGYAAELFARLSERRLVQVPVELSVVVSARERPGLWMVGFFRPLEEQNMRIAAGKLVVEKEEAGADFVGTVFCAGCFGDGRVRELVEKEKRRGEDSERGHRRGIAVRPGFIVKTVEK